MELLQTNADDPNSASQCRSKVIAYGDLGEAYALLATGTRDGAKAETWPLAREMYHRSLHLMEDLRDRGILDAEEIPEIETMKAKIAESDAALEERHQ